MKQNRCWKHQVNQRKISLVDVLVFVSFCPVAPGSYVVINFPRLNEAWLSKSLANM